MDITILTWDESVKLVRETTDGQIALLRDDECVWLQWVGAEMTLQLQDDLVSNPVYLTDVLNGWEKWPDEWANS